MIGSAGTSLRFVAVPSFDRLFLIQKKGDHIQLAIAIKIREGVDTKTHDINAIEGNFQRITGD